MGHSNQGPAGDGGSGGAICGGVGRLAMQGHLLPVDSIGGHHPPPGPYFGTDPQIFPRTAVEDADAMRYRMLALQAPAVPKAPAARNAPAAQWQNAMPAPLQTSGQSWQTAPAQSMQGHMHNYDHTSPTPPPKRSRPSRPRQQPRQQAHQRAATHPQIHTTIQHAPVLQAPAQQPGLQASAQQVGPHFVQLSTCNCLRPISQLSLATPTSFDSDFFRLSACACNILQLSVTFCLRLLTMSRSFSRLPAASLHLQTSRVQPVLITFILQKKIKN
ncbi:hypothetical protein V490_07876 [Pseudogymnoascus sp. VKM F-3557]|nr:hypothetical protein V490_07876 [Pseudogymnoascus sp. VKM F-3557]